MPFIIEAKIKIPGFSLISFLKMVLWSESGKFSISSPSTIAFITPLYIKNHIALLITVSTIII